MEEREEREDRMSVVEGYSYSCSYQGWRKGRGGGGEEEGERGVCVWRRRRGAIAENSGDAAGAGRAHLADSPLLKLLHPEDLRLIHSCPPATNRRARGKGKSGTNAKHAHGEFVRPEGEREGWRVGG